MTGSAIKYFNELGYFKIQKLHIKAFGSYIYNISFCIFFRKLTEYSIGALYFAYPVLTVFKLLMVIN